MINRAVGWINRYLRDDELPAVRELGSKLKVVELKQLLREQGLRQSGKKSELVRRLVDEGLSAERLVASGRVMSENAATAATAVARAATEREAAAHRRYKLTVLRSLAQIELAAGELSKSPALGEGEVAPHETALIDSARLSYPFLLGLAQRQFREGYRAAGGDVQIEAR